MLDLLADEEGYMILIHREWDTAYAFVKDLHPDLVILDVRIGGEEHGWDIVKLLTGRSHSARVPFRSLCVRRRSKHFTRTSHGSTSLASRHCPSHSMSRCS